MTTAQKTVLIREKYLLSNLKGSSLGTPLVLKKSPVSLKLSNIRSCLIRKNILRIETYCAAIFVIEIYCAEFNFGAKFKMRILLILIFRRISYLSLVKFMHPDCCLLFSFRYIRHCNSPHVHVCFDPLSSEKVCHGRLNWVSWLKRQLNIVNPLHFSPHGRKTCYESPCAWR